MVTDLSDTPFIRLAKLLLMFREMSEAPCKQKRQWRREADFLWAFVGAREQAFLMELLDRAIVSLEERDNLRRLGCMPACDGGYHARRN